MGWRYSKSILCWITDRLLRQLIRQYHASLISSYQGKKPTPKSNASISRAVFSALYIPDHHRHDSRHHTLSAGHVSQFAALPIIFVVPKNAAMAEVRQVYRFLLRTVRDRISSRKENSIWHDYIVEEFHRNASESDPAKAQKLLQIAKDYAQLAQDVHYEKVQSAAKLSTLGVCSSKYALLSARFI